MVSAEFERVLVCGGGAAPIQSAEYYCIYTLLTTKTIAYDYCPVLCMFPYFKGWQIQNEGWPEGLIISTEVMGVYRPCCNLWLSRLIQSYTHRCLIPLLRLCHSALALTGFNHRRCSL